MEKGFLHNDQKFPAIERTHLILTILWGIFYSFLFYSLLYLSRETIRLFSITEKYDIWILSDQEVNFYNLFFAFLSLIFAQSICLSQWFGKTRKLKLFEKTNIQKFAIVNDQRFLNIIFIAWFFRLLTIYGMFIGIGGSLGFYAYNLYPKYNFFFILILIVLFLQTWVNIRRVYKRRALKWMLISASIISILAFAYSRINLIDYQALNKMILDKNIAHKYNLELAEVNTFGYFSVLLKSEIYIVREQSDTAKVKNPLFIFNGKELSLDELGQKLQIPENRYRYFPYQLHFPLYIDKSIKMSDVNRLKEVMQNVGINRVGYAVIPKNREFDQRYYSNHYSVWRLIDRKNYEDIDLKEYELLSVSYVNDNLQINDSIFSRKDFYSAIKQKIEKHDNYLVMFAVDDEMIFADYIFILSELKRAIETIRNQYIMKKTAEFEGMRFRERERIIQNKIPLRIMEINKTE